VGELRGKVSLGLNTGGHTEPIYQMQFTPDGKKLVTARGAEVRVWDVATGKQEQVWRLPGGNGLLAVSPDGKTVATAGPIQGQTGNVAIWLLPLNTAKLSPEPVPEVIRLPPAVNSPCARSRRSRFPRTARAWPGATSPGHASMT
jgi:WD40 repeat protein